MPSQLVSDLNGLWPREIDSDEIIVRGICTPYHASASKGRLKPEAFHPTPNTNDVSVMRHRIIGTDGCRDRAKDLVNPLIDSDKIYSGLAAMRASEIIRVANGLVDSREEFIGHADIKVFGRVPGEPPSPEYLKKQRDMSKVLQGIAKYYIDSSPNASKWMGQDLLPPAQ
jgi:hypothetical protein